MHIFFDKEQASNQDPAFLPGKLVFKMSCLVSPLRHCLAKTSENCVDLKTLPYRRQDRQLL